MGGSNRSSSGRQMSRLLLLAMAGVLDDATHAALKSSTCCSSVANSEAAESRFWMILVRLDWRERGKLVEEEEYVEDDTAIVPRRRRNATAETFVMVDLRGGGENNMVSRRFGV